MREKIEKFWTKIRSKVKRKSNNDFKYSLEIPLSGIKQDQIKFNKDSGTIVIDAEQQIVIEEADRFGSSKMYTSYGFYRSIFLPEGVKVQELDAHFYDDRLLFGWSRK